MDYIVRATAAGGQVRAFAAYTKDLVEKARSLHNTSPVVTAALGRLLTGAGMMGAMMKGDKDLLTLQIKGAGPVGGLTVTADSHGNVKGMANVPDAMMPPNAKGKLDVGGVIGPGFLTVIKDMGLKEPYNSQVMLQTSEIGDDLTYYFTASEQVPSAVGLGVLMNKNNTVRQAGGFIIQLMPFAEESVISKLEENIARVSSVTDLLDQGYTPEKLLEYILGDLDLTINDNIQTQFVCNCSKERVKNAIASIQRSEIQEMIDENKPIEVKCHFCNTNYIFGIDELKEML